MAYNNRLNSCTPCNSAKYGTNLGTKSSVKQPEVKKCDTRQITSISLIKDKVVVMFDDCSYITANKSVIDNNFCPDLAEQSNQSIAEVNEALNKLQEQVNTLGSKVDNLPQTDTTDLQNKLTTLENKLNDTIEITTLDGTVSFKAFRP